MSIKMLASNTDYFNGFQIEILTDNLLDGELVTIMLLSGRVELGLK